MSLNFSTKAERQNVASRLWDHGIPTNLYTVFREQGKWATTSALNTTSVSSKSVRTAKKLPQKAGTSAMATSRTHMLSSKEAYRVQKSESSVSGYLPDHQERLSSNPQRSPASH